MFAFLALLFVLIVIYHFTSSSKFREGFDPVNTSPSHKVNIPVNVIPPSIPPPPARSIEDSNVKPSDLPGSLPIAPYEQIAAMSPLPYQDTTLIKANRQQLVSMLELLKGFLAFEAQEISERSDPTIQLPLNTARADFRTLQAEVEVLNRNPGLQPTITLSHLNEIASNLSYLQREVRLIGAAGPIQGPIYEFTQPVQVKGGALEGFVDATTGTTTSTTTGTTTSTTTGTTTDTATGTTTGTTTQDASKQVATPDELKEFVSKLQAEIIRLSASGTTDPIVNARIVALTNLKSNIQTILDQVYMKALLPSEIPVMKADIDKAFPTIQDINQPIPEIIKRLGLPPWLANLLPANIQNDPAITRQINKLIDNYADTVVNGLSASFAVKYTSPRQVEQAKARQSTLCKTGFPSMADLDNVSNAKFTPCGGERAVTDPLAQRPTEEGRGPAHFDWKNRSKEIAEQIKKRGLNPSDFGVMKQNEKVSKDFSWKGYAYMMCTRLQATMDPALPETCGCPPMDWKGWHISK
jgi:hypothetical protein